MSFFNKLPIRIPHPFFFLKKSESSTALEITDRSIKIVFLRKKGKNIFIEKQILLDLKKNTKEKIYSILKKNLKKNTLQGKQTCCLQNHQILVKPFILNTPQKKLLSQAIHYQLNQESTLNKEDRLELILSSDLKKQEPVCVCIGKQSFLEKLINNLSVWQFFPDYIGISPLCQASYLKEFLKISTSNFLIFDLGSFGFSASLFQNNQLSFHFNFMVEEKTFIHALKEEKKLSKDQAIQMLYKEINLSQKETLPCLFKVRLEDLAKEIHRCYFFCSCRSKNFESFFTGEFSTTQGFEKWLKKNLIFEETKTSILPKEKALFSNVTGNALSAFRNSLFHKNFLSSKNSPLEKQRKRKVLLDLLKGFILFFLLLFCLLQAFSFKKQKQLQKSVQFLYNQLNIPQKQSKKTPFLTKEIIESIEKLKKEKDKRKKNQILLQPPYPQIPELFAWLESLGVGIYEEKTTKPLKLLNFKFKIKDLPNLQEPQKKYKHQLSILLNTPSNKEAYAFYKDLKKDTYFVDKKQEIIWKKGSEQHEYLFFLKEIF